MYFAVLRQMRNQPEVPGVAANWSEVKIPAADPAHIHGGGGRSGFTATEESVARWLWKSFKEDKMTRASSHSCTDCFYEVAPDNVNEVGRRFVTCAVADGVNTPPAICGRKGCCGELENQTHDLYCREHFNDHAVCGVRAGPGLSGPCQGLVVGAERCMDAAGNVTKRPKHKACKEHAALGRSWIENGRQDTDDYFFALREAGKSGSFRRATGGLEARRVTPQLSDHCKGGWSGRAEDGEAKADATKCFTVRFTKQYAACFFLISRPGGFTLWVKLLPESESPSEVLKAGEECFGSDKPSVMQFDSTCRVTPTMHAAGAKNCHLAAAWERGYGS